MCLSVLSSALNVLTYCTECAKQVIFVSDVLCQILSDGTKTYFYKHGLKFRMYFDLFLDQILIKAILKLDGRTDNVV